MRLFDGITSDRMCQCMGHELINVASEKRITNTDFFAAEEQRSLLGKPSRHCKASCYASLIDSTGQAIV